MLSYYSTVYCNLYIYVLRTVRTREYRVCIDISDEHTEVGMRCGARYYLKRDRLKSERIGCDLKFIINRVAERPTATASATVHALSVCDAQDLSLKTPEAPETRLDQPLTTRAAHVL